MKVCSSSLLAADTNYPRYFDMEATSTCNSTWNAASSHFSFHAVPALMGFLPVYVVTSDRGRASAVTAKAFMLTQRPWPEQSSGQPDRSQAAPEKPSKHSHSPVSRLQSPLCVWIMAHASVGVRVEKTRVAQIGRVLKLALSTRLVY